MTVTLTAIVTAHSEGRLLRPTIRSVRAGLEKVVSDGYSAELLIVADNASPHTQMQIGRELKTGSATVPSRAINVAVGDAGAARNAAAQAAQGKYVALVDGDDIVSSDYLVKALELLEATDERMIVHPEYVISFGARSLLWHIRSAVTDDVSYLDLIRHNPWPACSVLERQVLLDTPYRPMVEGTGYGPEDWLWNIETTAAGVRHHVATDTYFFYRVRESGGVNNRHSASVLPSFSMSEIEDALPNEDNEEQATTNVPPLSHRIYRTVLPTARFATSWLSWEAKHAIYRSARWALRAATRRGKVSRTELPLRSEYPPLAAALREATSYEPAISWTASAIDGLVAWEACDDGYGRVLKKALDQIGERGDALVMVPWLGVGGADLVSLNYARALNETSEFHGRTTILGTFDVSRTDDDLIPDELNYVHLDPLWLELPLRIRQRLIAQLVVLLRPRLIVSVNCFHLLEALSAYAAPITDGTDVHTTLFSFDKIGDGYPTNPITDDAQRAFLDHIAGVLTDNSNSAALIDDVLALPTPNVAVHVHRQPAEVSPQGSLISHPATPSATVRLLWPHRLDIEKRPDVLPAIAHGLAEAGVDAVIDVWGKRVLSENSDTLMADLARAGVRYRGPYTGGLSAINLSDYDALLLTSENEGLPLVLVQSMLLGLPVIASGVGGVPDIVHDGETGLLTSGPEDVAGYVRAVARLVSEEGLREGLISRGRVFAEQHHSWAAFVSTVERDLVHPRARREREPVA